MGLCLHFVRQHIHSWRVQGQLYYEYDAIPEFNISSVSYNNNNNNNNNINVVVIRIVAFQLGYFILIAMQHSRGVGVNLWTAASGGQRRLFQGVYQYFFLLTK